MVNKIQISQQDIEYYLDYFEKNFKQINNLCGGFYNLPDYITDSIRKFGINNEEVLQEISNSISLFIGVKKSPRIKFLEKDNQNHAGSFNNNLTNPIITILENQNYGIVDYIAILVHENIHHFLLVQNISFTDIYKNELLTELVGIYLGFGPIIQYGYRDNELVTNGLIYTKTEITSIGYISNFTILQAISIVSKKRRWNKQDYQTAISSINSLNSINSGFDFSEFKRIIIILVILIISVIIIKTFT